MSQLAASPGAGLPLSPAATEVLNLTRNRWRTVRAHIAAFVPPPARPYLQSIELLAACVYVIDDVSDRSTGLPSVRELQGAFLPWLLEPASSVESSTGIRELLHTVDQTLAPAPAEWHRQWRHEGERLIDAMWREREWSANQTAVRLDVYLRTAADSIATKWVATSVACCLGDDAPIDALAPFARASEAVAQALRLANDLATHRRETSEGVVNAITIWRASPGADGRASIQEAVRAVEALRQRAFTTAKRQSTTLLTAWPHLRFTLEGMLRVVGEHWRHSDYARPTTE